MLRAIMWSVMLIVLGVLVIACVGNENDPTDVGGESTLEATIEGDEGSEETLDLEDEINAEGIEINILSVESMPDSNPMMGTISFRTSLEVEIGNSGDETVEFDQVRGVFYQNSQFTSGTKCGLMTSGGMVCYYWYDEGDIPPFEESVKTVSLTEGRAIVIPLDSGVDFDIDLPGKHFITIAVLLDDLPLVEVLYEY